MIDRIFRTAVVCLAALIAGCAGDKPTPVSDEALNKEAATHRQMHQIEAKGNTPPK